MADNGTFPDDISDLWGSEPEGALTPAAAPPVDDVPHPVVERAATNGNGNGSAMASVDHAVHTDVAKLANAIASDQVRRADLQALRTEFSHQLGVALYELVSVSNSRLADAENHINERLAAVVQAHTERLATAIEAQSRTAVDMAQAVRAEIDSVREMLASPTDGLVALQRDVRHQAERLSDEMTAQVTQSTQRLDAQAEGRHRLEVHAAKTESELGDLGNTLAAIKDEISEIRQEVTVLRDTVETQSRKFRRWGRAR